MGAGVIHLRVEHSGQRKIKLPEPIEPDEFTVLSVNGEAYSHGYDFEIRGDVLIWKMQLIQLSPSDDIILMV